MYESYWHLEHKPFQEAADEGFFFQSDAHRAALLKLRYVVEQGHTAAMLVGEHGAGKTYLTRRLAAVLPEESACLARVDFPQLSPAELLGEIAFALGAHLPPSGREPGMDAVLRVLRQQLTALTGEGRRPVLVVDDAHLIEDPRVFHMLVMLLNFRRPPDLELGLVLVGHWPLLSQVARVAALNERISVKALLDPLSPDETARYVQHRLHAAGARQSPFDRSAIQALYELSGGVPRRINHLCDLALLVGYADGLSSVTRAEVEAVAEEIALPAAA